MSTAETVIVNTIMKDLSPHGVRLWRNVRGMFLTPDGRHRIAAGLLAPGASDLIGFVPVTITADMVGKKIAKIVVIEVKTATGRVSPEQAHFVNFIRENGGCAGVARSVGDAKEIMHITP